jgi:hypothetical protein
MFLESRQEDRRFYQNIAQYFPLQLTAMDSTNQKIISYAKWNE